MQRIFLFLVTNFAVMLVFGVVASFAMPALGINPNGLAGLLFMCFLFGMGGSLVSLQISRWLAKRSVGAQVINDSSDPQAKDLVQRVQTLVTAANLPMPEVAVYNSPDVNAFATGPSKSKSLVAVSTGLLNTMTREEVDAVLAHEISHIANGDMVTLTLIQGVMNTFVMFFAHVIANIITSSMRNGNAAMGFMARFAVVMALQFVFGLIAAMIVNWFSRKREYAADKGAASLVGAPAMVAALERLQSGQESQLEGEMLAFGIKGKASLFATHPSLDSRIAALKSQ